MPKGKESQFRQRQNFNKIDINSDELKYSIRKMADYANSSTSNGKDSFLDGNETAVVPKNDPEPASSIEKMDLSGNELVNAPETPKNQGEVKLPNFKKKVKPTLNKIFILFQLIILILSQKIAG